MAPTCLWFCSSPADVMPESVLAAPILLKLWLLRVVVVVWGNKKIGRERRASKLIGDLAAAIEPRAGRLREG